MSDFNSQINDLIEYKKLIVKLEEALKLKEEENQRKLKINLDLKELIEEMKKELNSQNQRIIQQQSEIKNISKKYENEINQLNTTYENEKQKYDEKIFELSAYNPQKQEAKIKNDIETKYKIIIKNKDLEISNLTEEIYILYLIFINFIIIFFSLIYCILKINLNEQLYTERETHSYQMKDLIMKISNQKQFEKADEEKEILKEFKLSTKQNEEKSELLHKELDQLRTEKAQNEIKYNIELFELDTKLKEQIDNNQILINDIDSYKENIEKIKMFLFNKDDEINKLIEENRKINQDKENLMLNIQEKENLIEEQIIGLNELKKNYKLINNDIKIKKEENKNLAKKISELEEKMNKEQKPDNDNIILNSLNATKENENLFKEAYEEIREKYRRLMKEQTKNISEIENKNEEIKTLKSKIKRLKKDKNDNYFGNEDIIRKYTEINQKKNYYKQQCKNANKYILKISEILTNEQKQNLKNEGIILNNFNDNINNSESSKDN